ncbi:lipopolysaccharide assembly protein LapA domain-containing protein [Pseudomonas chlororaphis]|uniref:lipopolysaccharide assembly protein LapA domain-containing protein n=1 Tax=Pseudomonas chlororaphis TaxID=587753 RepID=UPI000F565426|nr:lipopolysaccharide assembly protein LapA domain-containing protein [Pseudomonas chlororaphis]WDG71130.1 lipopolysaccharide assembly protein LapA domain-containing protein [Pseudomonas chlororaphis]WDH31086.1 lipopolysaccharide assembly protein LapA domain-containing protein [Pseudomonas chlororaphis]WDH69656.1 lipopolysaccharide assembly protein LapA domain-containing protein [Pseudomonas chlororaphis]
MRALRRVLLVVVLLVLILLILIFVLENQETVALNFLGGSISEFPISIYIIISLLIGMTLGPLLRVAISVGRKR